MDNRELDAKVAIARGWTWHIHKYQGRIGLFPPDSYPWIWINYRRKFFDQIDQDDVDESKLFSDWDDLARNDKTGTRGLPRFSTNIADAHTLITEMRQAGYDVCLKMDRIGHGRDGLVSCQVYIQSDDGHLREFIEQIHETEEIAVCEAYLKWKGAQE
jgi:hypothetical protein